MKTKILHPIFDHLHEHVRHGAQSMLQALRTILALPWFEYAAILGCGLLFVRDQFAVGIVRNKVLIMDTLSHHRDVHMTNTSTKALGWQCTALTSKRHIQSTRTSQSTKGTRRGNPRAATVPDTNHSNRPPGAAGGLLHASPAASLVPKDCEKTLRNQKLEKWRVDHLLWINGHGSKAKSYPQRTSQSPLK